MRLFLIVIMLFVQSVIMSQSPTISVLYNDNVCIDEEFVIENNSTNFSLMEWDFCIGDMEEVPDVAEIVTNTGLNIPYSIDLIKDNQIWYGLIPSRGNNEVVLAKFEGGLKSEPIFSSFETFVDIDGPTGISILDSSNYYYAYTCNFDNGNIVRLDFGNSMENEPNYENLGSYGFFTASDGIKIVNDEIDSYKLIVLNGQKVGIIDFGDQPKSEGILTSFTISASSRLWGIDVFSDNDNWYGLATSFNNGAVFHLSFGANLNNTPIITELPDDGFNIGSPGDIKIVKDNDQYYAILQARDGDIYKYSFGASLSNISPVVDQLGGFDIIGNNSSGLSFAKDRSELIFINTEYSNNSINYISFKKDCGLDQDIYFENNPIVQLGVSGTYPFEVTAINDSISVSETEELTVAGGIAPSISITPQDNECLGQPNNFIPIDDGSLVYEWSFDGGETLGSTASSPIHTYSATGDSVVVLSVDDGTCTNLVIDTVSIYPVPTPTFTTPDLSCTNTELTFTNTTDESNHEGATITYTWDYGDGNSEESEDGNPIYTTANNYDITLNMAISGCSTDDAETIEVISGPEVFFITDNNCFGESMQFINQTTGEDLINPSWDFGDDAGLSTLSEPKYIYGEAGDFEVSLTMENTEGCVSSLTETVRVNGVPEVGFTNTPACENQAVSFTDISTSGDALNNVNSWSWDFGVLGSSSDQNPDFIFEASENYTVGLTVGNTGDCFNTIEQTVVVQPVPVPDFDIDLGCIDETTEFTDNSTTIAENEIASWYWVINETEYFTQNVAEIFSDTGTYTANLVVTPTNLCVTTIQKEFSIYSLPEVGFTIEDNCDNELTVFSDTSTSLGKNIVSRAWNFENGDAANGQEVAYQYHESGNYEVNLQVTDNIGCINSIEKEVEIHQAPTASFSTSVVVGGAPLDVDFSNESINGTSYLWSFGDISTSQATDENTQFVYQTLGEYEAQLIAYNENCSDSTSIEIIVAEPWFDLQLTSVENRETNGVYNIYLTIENEGLVNLDGFDIKIDFENQSSIYENYDEVLNRNQAITIPLNFTLPVEGNNVDFLCFTISDREEEVLDSLSNNNSGCISFEEQAVVQSIFPNPLGADSYTLTVQTILSASSAVEIYIIDATSSIMYDEQYQSIDLGLTSFEINVANLQAGMYLVKILHNGKEQTKKFIKQ